MKKALSLVIILALLCTPQAAAIATDPALATSTLSEREVVVPNARNRSDWQLTSAELNAPTEELVKSILESPYILGLFASSSSDHDTYASMRTYFNGLPELESREDASSVMLSLLEEITTSPIEPGSLDMSYLHYLLSEPIYFSRLTEREKTIYICLHINRTDIVIIGSPCVDPGLVFAERYHCTFTFNNSATHTRTYTTYGWSVTEAHTPNVKTGNCIGCGLKGPFSYARG